MPQTGSTSQTENANDSQAFFVGFIVGIVVLTVILIAGAVVLAVYADTAAPAVEIVRDLLIITLALELAAVATAIAVFIVQVGRFVNLLNNEITPIITSTQDTVNVVKGTAVFISKNAVEPIVSVVAALRGIGSVLKDIDAIGKAAGIGAAVASAMSATGTHTTGFPTDKRASQTPSGDADEKGSTASEDSTDDEGGATTTSDATFPSFV